MKVAPWNNAVFCKNENVKEGNHQMSDTGVLGEGKGIISQPERGLLLHDPHGPHL